jgi:hypothetical protein
MGWMQQVAVTGRVRMHVNGTELPFWNCRHKDTLNPKPVTRIACV